ncbi:MAG: ATP synthase subunit I [Pseudomonadota bacterium]
MLVDKNQMDWQIVYRDIKALNWITLLILSSLSFFLMSPSHTSGIILGGLIIIANFGLFQHTIHCAFSPEGVMRVRGMSIIAKYYFRLLALGVIIFFLISFKWIHPVGLAIGLSTVVISIVSFGIKRAWQTFFSEAT